jgi:hypothetical protein
MSARISQPVFEPLNHLSRKVEMPHDSAEAQQRIGLQRSLVSNSVSLLDYINESRNIISQIPGQTAK